MSLADFFSPLSASEWSAIMLSLRVGIVCVLMTLVPGISLGWLLARKRFAGRSLLEALTHLPLILPPVVVGFVLLILLGRNGPLGALLYDALGIRLVFTWWAAVIASAVMGFPLLARSTKLAVELIDRRMEQAAMTLGASPLRVWFTVTMPLALPGVLAGMVLCFARSMGEFGATITFAGNMDMKTRTLPLAIYTTIQDPGASTESWRLVIIAVIVAVVAMLGAELVNQWMKRRLAGDDSNRVSGVAG